MPNDIPSRPQTLDDLITGLMQSQDDSGDSADTQLFDAQVLTETVAITDATTLSVHPATYRYDAWADYDALVPLENPLHWWKCHEASGNLADSGSSPVALVPSGTPSYSQTGPIVNFPAETAVNGEFAMTAPAPALFSMEIWLHPVFAGSFAGSFFDNPNLQITLSWDGTNLTPTFSIVPNPPGAPLISIPRVSAPGGWSHWVFTFDGSLNLQTWANGALGASLTLATAISVPTAADVWAFFAQPGTSAFCELAIYDHVLTPSVIAQHYQVGAQGVPDARYGYAVYA